MSSPDFEPVTREMVVFRGSENTQVASISLVPKFGFAVVDSLPDAASVEVLDDQNAVVARGTTPFNTPRLRSGTYKLRLSKHLYASREQELIVPSGNQLQVAPKVQLEPLTKETGSFDFMRRVRKETAVPVTIKANRTPLSEVLSELNKQTKLSIFLDQSAASASTPITLKVDGIPLSAALKLLGAPLGLGWYPHKDTNGDKYSLIVTPHYKRQLTVVAYPADELIPDDRRVDLNTLFTAITDVVGGAEWQASGGPGTLNFDHQHKLLIVNASWEVQCMVDDYLNNYRERNAVSRPKK